MAVDCIQRNTLITGYTVRYDPSSRSIDGTNEVTASGDGVTGGSVTLTGLFPLTNYSIQVAADSDLGHGPFSEAIIFMTAEARELFMTDSILLYQLPSQLPFSFPYSIRTCSFTISRPNGDHNFSIMERA